MRPLTIDAPKEIAVAASEVGLGMDTKPDLVADDHGRRNTCSGHLRRALGRLDDGVVRQSCEQRVRHEQGEAVDDHEVIGVDVGECAEQVGRYLDSWPGRALGPVARDSLPLRMPI